MAHTAWSSLAESLTHRLAFCPGLEGALGKGVTLQSFRLAGWSLDMGPALELIDACTHSSPDGPSLSTAPRPPLSGHVGTLTGQPT